MKNRNLPICVLSATLFATLLLASCKKESAVADKGSTGTNEAQTESTLKRIMDFKGQMEYYRAHPDMRDGESTTVEDAIWNIEALFNLTYAYPELAYNHTVVCDTVLYLAIDTDGTVPLSRLTAFYDEMHEVVATLYHGLDIDNKQFLILDVEEGERQGGSLAIGLHSVQGGVREGGDIPPGPDVSITEIGPFVYGPSWYYGENGGNSWGIDPMDMDAADTLTFMLKSLLIPQAPDGFVYIYTNTILRELFNGDHYPFSHVSYPGVGQYCEFYVPAPTGSDFWLDTDQLNFYYFGERYLVQSVLPTYGGTSLPLGHRLCSIVINDYRITQTTVLAIGHHTRAFYAHREVLGQGSVVRGNL